MKVRANVNFALIKYWGKKIDDLKVPYQSSLSVTIDKLYTETEVVFDRNLNEDVIKINGKTTGKEIERTRDYLNVLRNYYNISEYCYLESLNYVPTASGLASSASAFASIAKAFLQNKDLSDVELSKAARLGSGSASRSIYDGFAIWNHGDSHETSYATPLDIKWPEFRIIVCLVDKNEKKYSSSLTMSKSVLNSNYKKWVKESKKDLALMLEALPKKEIDLVGKIAEANSNKMHDLIEEDGIYYKNLKSLELIKTIENLRKQGISAYYTMDAGPNVKIITTEKYVESIIEKIDVQTIICEVKAFNKQ